MTLDVEISERDGAPFLRVVRGGWRAEYTDLVEQHGVRGVSVKTEDPDGIRFLDDLPHLTTVSVTVERVSDLAPLASVRALEHLYVGVAKRSKRPLELAPFPRLRQLVCDAVPELRALFENESLEHLRTNSPGPDLTSLAHLQRLRRLSINTARKLESLDGIGALQRLEWLELAFAPKLRDFSALSQLSMLRIADLHSCRGLDSLQDLGTLARLQWLWLENANDVPSLRPVRNFPQLEFFGLIGPARVLDGDLSPLLDLPNLRAVALQHRRGYRPLCADVEAALAVRCPGGRDRMRLSLRPTD